MKLYLDSDHVCHTMHEASMDMICFEEFENNVKWIDDKPYVYGSVKEIETSIQPVHVLLNTSMIDEKWIYMNLRKYISKYDRVCVLPFSFFDDTKNVEDWNRQYAPGKGIWYRSNQDVFYKYGIPKENIVWVNYFEDSIETMRTKVLNSSVVLLTGGAPDLMMKRIKEKKLKKILKNYKGVMIGYSAGAMIQLDQYHISPDEDYPGFSYQQGLGCLSGFDMEVHFRKSRVQMQSIEKVQLEKNIPVYGIYEDGGIIISKDLTCFGRVDSFETES